MALNITRFLFLTLILTGAALITQKSALAKKPEIYFYTSGPWALSSKPVSVDGAQTQSCSIRNEFNNGFILQINGSHKWVENMSVDFRQDIFEPGENYEVSLAVPGSESIRAQSTAQSKGVLSIDIRNQKNFYRSMRGAAVFDLGIDKNSFRFYTPGLASSADSFERCMAGGDIPAGKTSVTSNEAIAMEDEESRRIAEQDLEILEPMDLFTEDFEPQTVPIEEIGIEDPEPFAQPVKRKRLSETLAEEMTRDPGVATLEVKEAKSAPAKPIKEAKKKDPEPPIKVKKEVFEMEADFTNLSEVEPASSGGNDFQPGYRPDPELVKKISALERAVAKLEHENAGLDAELKSALKESEQEHLSISSENWNLEQATMRYHEAERQLRRLGQQLQKERAQHNVEKRELESMLFDPQVTDERQLARLAELEQKLMAARRKIQQLENQVNSQ